MTFELLPSTDHWMTFRNYQFIVTKTLSNLYVITLVVVVVIVVFFVVFVIVMNGRANDGAPSICPFPDNTTYYQFL